MSDWIADLCKAALGDNFAKAGRSLDVAVRHSAMATRNVRVEQGTAANVTIGCHDFVNDAMHSLIESGISDKKIYQCRADTGWLGSRSTHVMYFLARTT